MKESLKTLERRVSELENKRGINQPDLVVTAWSPGDDTGLYGHVHIRVGRHKSKLPKRVPCTDEEEIKIMREHYEKYLKLYPNRRFSDHLEEYDRRGPESRKEDRRKLIEQIRKEEAH